VEDALRVEADVHAGARLGAGGDLYSAAARRRKRRSTGVLRPDYDGRMGDERRGLERRGGANERRRRGVGEARAVTTCRADTLVKLTQRLRR
jgi:hypothetical protein